MMLTALQRVFLSADRKSLVPHGKGGTILIAGKGMRLAPEKIAGLDVAEGLFDNLYKPKRIAASPKDKAPKKGQSEK